MQTVPTGSSPSESPVLSAGATCSNVKVLETSWSGTTTHTSFGPSNARNRAS